MRMHYLLLAVLLLAACEQLQETPLLGSIFNSSKTYFGDVQNGTNELVAYYNASQEILPENDAKQIGLELFTEEYFEIYTLRASFNPGTVYRKSTIRNKTILSLAWNKSNEFCYNAQINLSISQPNKHLLTTFPKSVKVVGTTAKTFKQINCAR